MTTCSRLISSRARPICRPSSRARLIPLLTRSTTSDLSSSAIAEMIVTKRRPMASPVATPSQSGKDSEVTGTLEEFNLAVRLHDETVKRQLDANKPVVWVYFRVPTAEPDDQLRGVLAFRKKLEEGRQLFFREYTSVEDWEEMLRQHLVAYLGDLHRWDLNHNRESMRPELRLMQGDFLAEGIYDFGSRMKLQVDLDGDGSPELVTFWFAVNSYNLTLTRHDSTFALPLNYHALENARLVHVAIKDVTNDGLPEILLAASDGPASLRLFVWGLNQSGRQERKLSEETFVALADFAGQYRAQILEGGTIVLPYPPPTYPHSASIYRCSLKGV
jgi:hypothetical protein